MYHLIQIPKSLETPILKVLRFLGVEADGINLLLALTLTGTVQQRQT